MVRHSFEESSKLKREMISSLKRAFFDLQRHIFKNFPHLFTFLQAVVPCMAQCGDVNFKRKKNVLEKKVFDIENFDWIEILFSKI